MRRMIEAAELKNQRTVAPEAHSMHLTPDTDPASTFRLRNMGNRPRLDSLQFSMSSPPSSAQVNFSQPSWQTSLRASLAWKHASLVAVCRLGIWPPPQYMCGQGTPLAVGGMRNVWMLASCYSKQTGHENRIGALLIAIWIASIHSSVPF